jgi:alginate O-acetyltransferase complex protein AlgI
LSGVFKLFSLPEIHIDVHLPIGISFFTFQALSYIIDVYRAKTPAQKNPLNIALYISLFPQLIAGPIIRYTDIVTQLTERKVKIQNIVSGIKLFVIGLGKKVLIADTLARVVDKVFALPENQLAFELAWLGLLSFTLQIYFDFSGYSDMAIGLGRIFGFDFLKNFNYPYISKSLTEFWRRWHISLSRWLRDYLFLPIAYALMRKYTQPRLLRIKTENWAYISAMLATLFLGGLWHGASWNFVVWGIFHGFFVVLEKFRWGKILKRLWTPFQHIYTLTIILGGWVFFRSETFGYALHYFKQLVDFKQITTSLYFLPQYLNNQIILALVLGVVFSAPLFQFFWRIYHNLNKKCADLKGGFVIQMSLYSINLLFFMAIYLLSIMILAAETYFPFLYFRF